MENDTVTAKKKQDRAARFQSVIGKKQRIDSVRNISLKLVRFTGYDFGILVQGK